MNPRRVHELMRKHFPAFDAAKLEWTNLSDRAGPDRHGLETFLDKHIAAPEVLVEVHRGLGDFLPKSNAVDFIAQHIGEGEIRVTDRQFTSFVVVAQPGVATGWAKHDC